MRPPPRFSGRLPCILARKISKIYSLFPNRLTSLFAKTEADLCIQVSVIPTWEETRTGVSMQASVTMPPLTPDGQTDRRTTRLHNATGRRRAEA